MEKLSTNTSYIIGKFQMILNEETGDLRIIVHTNSDHMKITPKSDNSILIHACKSNKKNDKNNR